MRGEEVGGGWPQGEGAQVQGHCHCPQQKGRGSAGADACPMGGSQKAPYPQVPLAQKACLHPPSFWQMGRDLGGRGGGGGEQLHGLVVAVHAGGVENFDLAGSNASRSACSKLRARGVQAALHTSPPHCNQNNCMHIAMRMVLWHLQHPTTEWGNPHPPQQICHAREGV